MLLLLAGCGEAGSIAASVSGLLDDADRVRISLYDAAAFDCSLLFGPRPDPVVPRVVLPIGQMRTSLDVVPVGDHVLVLDLFDAEGADVGVGCSPVSVANGEITKVTIELAGYPEILASDPEPGASFISPTEQLRVIFSEPMDPSTVPTALRLERTDNSPAPVVRDAYLAVEDGTERSWGLEAPFGLDLDTEYRIVVDEDAQPRSAAGLPLRPFEGVTFRTDPVISVFRDLPPAVRNAVEGRCDCPTVDGVKRVADRLFLPGAPARLDLVPFRITEVRFWRDSVPFHDVKLTDTATACERIFTEYNLIVENEAGERCQYEGEVLLALEDCFCTEVSCDGSFDLERGDLTCSDG